MTKERKLPFDCLVGKRKVTVANRFSGETVKLQPKKIL